MQNKRGLELALSTVIVVVIVILVLVGITYLLTDGFKKFRGTTAPYLQSTQAIAIRQVCETACDVVDRVAFCDKYDWTDKEGKIVEKDCAGIYTEYKWDPCTKVDCVALAPAAPVVPTAP